MHNEYVISKTETREGKKKVTKLVLNRENLEELFQDLFENYDIHLKYFVPTLYKNLYDEDIKYSSIEHFCKTSTSDFPLTMYTIDIYNNRGKYKDMNGCKYNRIKYHILDLYIQFEEEFNVITKCTLYLECMGGIDLEIEIDQDIDEHKLLCLQKLLYQKETTILDIDKDELISAI